MDTVTWCDLQMCWATFTDVLISCSPLKGWVCLKGVQPTNYLALRSPQYGLFASHHHGGTFILASLSGSQLPPPSQVSFHPFILPSHCPGLYALCSGVGPAVWLSCGFLCANQPGSEWSPIGYYCPSWLSQCFLLQEAHPDALG